MRISVPSLPHPSFVSAKSILPSEAAVRLVEFLAKGNVTVLTGAGVSVDSGIRAYRGLDGRYMNPNYKPILYHELVDATDKGHLFRQRYWLRSYLGYPSVRNALPNPTHCALAALQYTSHIRRIITQNVDGLHQKALPSHLWNPLRIQKAVLELHGTLHRVHCKHGHTVDRELFQEWISIANPPWKEFFDEMQGTSMRVKTNPDGDVDIEHLRINYKDFVVPYCPSCLEENRRNNIHKPQLIFFGEPIQKSVKDESFEAIETGDRLLIIGTTLATYSAYRLLKHAVELERPVMLLNLGPSRADSHPKVEKIDMASGTIMSDVAQLVIGSRSTEDLVIKNMLRRGVVKPIRD